MTNVGSRSVHNVARMAMLLAAVSLVLCVAPARAQGVGPNVVLPTTRPRTNLPAPPPGTIAVQLFESPADDLQGMYILYLKVERYP